MNNHTVNSLFFSKTKKDVLDCIAAGIDINALDQSGKNALFYNYHFSAIEAMIEAGINLNHTDSHGNTVLFRGTTPEILRLLIDSGINIHHVNNRGETCLFHQWHNEECSAILIKAGVDVNSTDNDGQTLLYRLFRHDSLDYWVNAGCDLNHRDNDGNTALHLPDRKGIVYDYKLSAVTRHIDRTDNTPILFRHLSAEGLSLIALLHQKGLNFTIAEHCTLSLYVKDMKEFFGTLKTYTGISHVHFYNDKNKHICSYTGFGIIKWFIRNGIRMDDDILRKRADSDKVFDYIAGREKKDLFRVMKPELTPVPKKKRI